MILGIGNTNVNKAEWNSTASCGIINCTEKRQAANK